METGPVLIACIIVTGNLNARMGQMKPTAVSTCIPLCVCVVFYQYWAQLTHIVVALGTSDAALVDFKYLCCQSRGNQGNFDPFRN